MDGGRSGPAGEGRENCMKMVDAVARLYVPPVKKMVGGVEQGMCPLFVSIARHLKAASTIK